MSRFYNFDEKTDTSWCPSFCVDATGFEPVERPLDVRSPLRSVLNACHWHAAPLQGHLRAHSRVEQAGGSGPSDSRKGRSGFESRWAHLEDCRNGRRGRFKTGFLRVQIPCSSFTTGRNMPTIDYFIAMAGIFGVKVDDIIRIRMV